MHEISIAGAIVDAALDAAKKHGAAKVTEVLIEIGELTSLNPEQLSFIFGIITKGTLLEGADFRIHPVRTLIKCRACGYEGPIEFVERLHFVLPTIKCPKCEGVDIDILAGRECNLKSMKIL